MKSKIILSKNDVELLSMRDVCELIGVSKSTVCRMVKAERFPQPMKLTNKLPKWRRSEFYAWLESASTVATK